MYGVWYVGSAQEVGAASVTLWPESTIIHMAVSALSCRSPPHLDLLLRTLRKVGGVIPNPQDHCEAGVRMSTKGTCLAFRQHLLNSGCRDDDDSCPSRAKMEVGRRAPQSHLCLADPARCPTALSGPALPPETHLPTQSCLGKGSEDGLAAPPTPHAQEAAFLCVTLSQSAVFLSLGFLVRKWPHVHGLTFGGAHKA